MCQNLKVDKFTQDSRLLKMKVWLHFTKLLKEINKPDSNDSDFDQQNCDSYRELQRSEHTVVDVSLSTTTNPKLQLIFQMEITQQKIKEITQGLKDSQYKDDQKFKKEDELKEHKDIYEA